MRRADFEAHVSRMRQEYERAMKQKIQRCVFVGVVVWSVCQMGRGVSMDAHITFILTRRIVPST